MNHPASNAEEMIFNERLDAIQAMGDDFADDDPRVMTSQCAAGNHDRCPDIDANCCECICHLGLSDPHVHIYADDPYCMTCGKDGRD
jgi:hypothetical protein